MCKRAASRYRRGRRSKSWLKLKQRQTAEVLALAPAAAIASGLIERAAVTEPDRPGLQWAVVHHGALRRELSGPSLHDRPARGSGKPPSRT